MTNHTLRKQRRKPVLKVQAFTVGPLFTNCYVVSCEKTLEAIIIDPGFDTEAEMNKILDYAGRNGLEIKSIVNTHGHPDHTCGNFLIKENINAPILIHELDAAMLGETGKTIAQLFGFKSFSPPADKLLHDGDIIRFGEEKLEVLHTPGHSPGSLSLLGENLVFTGDTLFAGSVGRADLPGGSFSQLIRSIKERLAVLPDYYVVYPGHGPATTIGAEKQMNPFLQERLPFTLEDEGY